MTRLNHEFLEHQEVLDGDVLDDPYFAGRQRWESEHAFAEALKKRGRHPLDLYINGYEVRARQHKYLRLRETVSRTINYPIGAILSAVSGTASFVIEHFRDGFFRALKAAIIGVTAAIIGVTVAVVAATLVLSAYVGLNWSRIEGQLAIVRQNVECSKTIALRDDAGALIHVVPLLPDSACSQPSNEDGVRLARPVLSVPFDEPEAKAHAAAFRSIEGALWVNETLWGQDWRGPVRRMRGFVRELITGQEDRSGATGPIATVFEFLSHAYDLTVGEKFLSTVAASVYTARFLSTDADRIAFVNLAPAVANAVPLRSGELASLALLGKPAPATLADQCRFARAAGLPVPMVGARGVTGQVASRWAGHVGPGAAQCVRSLASSEAEVERALAELRSYCGDSDFCLDGQPHWHLIAKDERDAAKAIWMAKRRAIVAQETVVYYTQIPSGLGGSTTSLRDTIPPISGADGITSLQPSVQTSILRTVRDGYKSWASGEMPGVETAVAAFDVSTSNVLPLAVYGERSGAIYPPLVTGEAGERMMGLPAWHGASLNKIAIMMVAVREGIKDICLPGATCISLSTAFAESENDVFLDLARQLDPQLQELREALGYIGQAAQEPSSRARDAVYGFETRLPPYRFATLLGALLHGEAQSIHLVGETELDTVLDLDRLGFTATIRSEILDVLAAPVGQGGTLYSVVRSMDLPPNCDVSGGKTGTHGAKGVNLQRSSVLLVQCGNRHFVTFAVAAHPERLGLAHVDLAPIHAAAATAAAAID
jgi:hypothetical protein